MPRILAFLFGFVLDPLTPSPSARQDGARKSFA